jgi:hypothetical protein
LIEKANFLCFIESWSVLLPSKEVVGILKFQLLHFLKTVGLLDTLSSGPG